MGWEKLKSHLIPALCLVAGVAVGWASLSGTGNALWSKATGGVETPAPATRPVTGTSPRLVLAKQMTPESSAPAGNDQITPQKSIPASGYEEKGGLPRAQELRGKEADPPASNLPTYRAVKDGEVTGRHAPRLAIVIDDIGHNLRRPRKFLALGAPLTFSILPGLRHSTEAAQLIRRQGREFLIHLPMEPMNYPAQDPGPEAMLLRHSDDFTRRQVEGFFRNFPHAIGASNHMGSAYSYDARKMGIVQGFIGARRLLFLNSRTSASPVPSRIAASYHYRFLERNVFLDNIRNEGAIRAELKRALKIARKEGQAVAIGHPFPETYRVLQQALLKWERTGVGLVQLSTLSAP